MSLAARIPLAVQAAPLQSGDAFLASALRPAPSLMDRPIRKGKRKINTVLRPHGNSGGVPLDLRPQGPLLHPRGYFSPERVFCAPVRAPVLAGFVDDGETQASSGRWE